MNNQLEPANDLSEKALVEYQSAWHAGKRPDVGRFCENHPEGGDDLRERIINFLMVMNYLGSSKKTKSKEMDELG